MTAVYSCFPFSGITTSRKSLGSVLLAAIFVIAGVPASAQTSPGKFEITPYGGFRFGGTFNDIETDSRAELDDSASVGLVLDLRESGNTQWELIYAQQTTDADVADFSFAEPTIELDLRSLQIGGTYLGEGERVRPYVAATIGGTNISPSLSGLNDDTFWSFSIGGGLQVFPSQRLGLRLETRAWGTLLDSSTSLFCASGSNGGICAISIEGRMLWQIETFAGLVLRF